MPAMSRPSMERGSRSGPREGLPLSMLKHDARRAGAMRRAGQRECELEIARMSRDASRISSSRNSAASRAAARP